METPNLRRGLEFVPATNPPPKNDRSYTRLHSFGIQSGLSIEAVDINFTQTRPRSVYGTIYINTEYYQVHTLYNRLSHDPDTMWSPGHLTLTGPNYFLYNNGPTALYVDLSEVGSELPFFRARVPFQSHNGEPFTVDSPGKEASLTVHMTPISPCTLTKISVELSHDTYSWLVSGSVVAIQHLRTPPHGEKKERRVCLFERHEDGPMITGAKIKLDREVFHAPLWFKRSYIRKSAKLDREAGDPDDGIHPDGGFYHGDGIYVSVEIDLKLVDEASVDRYCFVRETLHYRFESRDVHETRFRACVRPKVWDGGEVEVAVTLQPFLDIMTRMDGEPYEEEMPLYEPPLESNLVNYIHSSDYSSSSLDDSSSSDDDSSLSDDDSISPIT